MHFEAFLETTVNLRPIGKSAFTRFDALVPGGLYALDSADPSDVAELAASVSRELSPVDTERFADHDAAEYTPVDRRPTPR